MAKEIKAGTNKKTTKKATTKKDVKETLIEGNIETKEEKIAKKATQRDIRNELKKKKLEIEVEVMNLTNGEVFYTPNSNEVPYFELNGIGDKEFVELDKLYKVASKHKAYFKNHCITIVDLDDMDYTVDDILDFLGIKNLYDNIENYDSDYIDYILNELDFDEFEDVVNNNSIELAQRLTERAVHLHKNDELDSSNKKKFLANKVNMPDLFNLI